MASEIFLIAGLGNPGDKYESTRHNIGFDIVDEIAREANGQISMNKWDALTAKINLWGATIHLVKPMTFMNLSGKSVARFLDFYKIPMRNLIVVHDDLDMSTARLKLVFGGGAGGHNGIRSIVSSIGNNEFYRLKIGIGRPGNGLSPKEMPVDKYVLTSFHTEEFDLINARKSEILKGLQYLLEDNPAKAKNFLNSFK